jgi:histidinol-phosphatase (PHP family)
MGILKINYHMHSQYSIDGEMSIEEACEKAIELGLKEIAFTDHLDIDWPDPNYEFGALDIEKYLIDIEKNRERYKDCLKIKTGIEVGLQPHVLEEVEDIIVTYPFDFVIASIHIIQRMDPYQGDYYKNRTKEECYRLYYEETLELVKEFSNFDVLGHIGYIRRYSPFPYEQDEDLICLSLIDEILKVLITKGKGIEVNTSGYKHASKTPMPTPRILARYKDLGGTIITLGSDAHTIDDVGFGLDLGCSVIRESGFKHITSYTERKPEFISII